MYMVLGICVEVERYERIPNIFMTIGISQWGKSQEHEC